MSNQGEYFEYRTSSKFIGEIQIIFSVIVLVSGTASVVSFSSKLETSVGHDRDIAMGYITYSSLAIIVAITDIVFAGFLISATRKINLGRCLLWRGSAVTTLGLFGLLTISFMTLMKTFTVFLGFVPTLVFKPFALWIVNGFIGELRQLENFPSDTLPPAKPSLSLQNPKQLKRTTTIFKRDSVYKPPRVVTSRISSIPEEN